MRALWGVLLDEHVTDSLIFRIESCHFMREGFGVDYRGGKKAPAPMFRSQGVGTETNRLNKSKLVPFAKGLLNRDFTNN